MAADCSDSLAAHIVRCVPHNGLTHGESALSLSTVHLLASSSLDFCLTPLSPVFWWRQRSLLMIAHFTCIVPFFFISVGISSSPLLSFLTRFPIIANSLAAFHDRIWTQSFAGCAARSSSLLKPAACCKHPAAFS